MIERNFIVGITPVGKPRMTQRDKWAKRPAVLRYREFADRMRLMSGPDLPTRPHTLALTFYLPVPPSWSRAKRLERAGGPHRAKPDLDNLIKAVQDSLWPDDSGIAFVTAHKRWDDGGGPRIVIMVEGDA